MFSLIGTLIIGLIVGAVAKLIMPGKDPEGIWITMALGVAGSLVATYLGRALGLYATGQAAGFVMSVLGALLILLLYRFIRGRPSQSLNGSGRALRFLIRCCLSTKSDAVPWFMRP